MAMHAACGFRPIRTQGAIGLTPPSIGPGISRRKGRIVPRDLPRAVGLRLKVEQLRVDAVPLDETVKRIAPASAALVALDGKDVELADDVAEYDRAVSGHHRAPTS